MIKLIVSDLDGTLLHDDKSIDEGIKETIKMLNDKGIIFTTASGRNKSIAWPIVKELGIEYPYIVDNGARLFLKDKLLFGRYIPKYCLNELIHLLMNNKIAFFLFLEGYSYSYLSSDSLEKKKTIFNSCGDYFINLNDDIDFDEISNAYKISFDPIDDEKITSILNIIKRKYKNISAIRSEGSICTITAKDTSKGDAVLKICEILNIKKEEVMTFGDNFNDVSMFEKAGVSVAANNADECVKRNANQVTLSNNENGVSYFINQYFDF